MPKLARLESRGLVESECHRLLVAYGLSFRDIGEVVWPDMFLEPPPRKTSFKQFGEHIGKEQM